MPLECSFPLDKIWLLWKKPTPVQISAGFTGTQKTVTKSFGCVEGISMKYQYPSVEVAVFIKMAGQ